jgi:small subunit ribosomal protein S4
MARYTGPKGRINRRLQATIYESSGAIKALDKRGSQPPGMHTRFRRPSNYGQALMEKQKIKHYYGLGERQLRRYFTKATRQKGNTGSNLLLLCEQRIDNVIRMVGLVRTRPQARQGVAHGHFLVNGAKMDRPSYHVRPGDVISIRPKANLLRYYKTVRETGVDGEGIDWVSFDAEKLTATVQNTPTAEDITLPVDANTVVEFLSR